MSKRKSVTHLLPKIIERDGGEWKCHYCGWPLIPCKTPVGTPPYFKQDYQYEYGEKVYIFVANGYAPAEVDHKTPVSKGGTDELDNLVAACRACNNQKQDQDYGTFKAKKL